MKHRTEHTANGAEDSSGACVLSVACSNTKTTDIDMCTRESMVVIEMLCKNQDREEAREGREGREREG